MKNSPLKELTAQDIARKQKKLGKIEGKLSNTNLSPKKEQRLKEKQHKTKYQIDTGQRGRPTSLRNEAWLASSPVNNYKDGYYGVERKSALNMLGVSPLNDMTEQENDSIAAVKAWDTFKSGYMNRPQNTPEYNQSEYDREKNEFYYNTEKKKMRLIPTDDGEIPLEGFKEGLKKWQLPPQK